MEGVVEQKQKEAFVHEVYARALRQAPIREAFELGRCTQEKTRIQTSGPSDATFWTIWRPRSEDINLEFMLPPLLPDKDPALGMKFRKSWYIVGRWDVEQEKPFEHYLREYALTDLDNK